MRMLIHDLSAEDYRKVFAADPDNCTVICDDGTFHQCIGCLSCWLKTPGECPMSDSFSRFAKTLSETDELILISRCVYGSVSPFIKNAFDRAIGYFVPTLEMRDQETHFKIRYPGHLRIFAHFYGPTDDEERKIASDYFSLAAKGLGASAVTVLFHNVVEEMTGAVL